MRYAIIIILLIIIIYHLYRVDNLDKNATEPLLLQSRVSMMFAPSYNPSSKYAEPEKKLIEKFKNNIAEMTGFPNIIITSGASESNSTILNNFAGKHIIISAYEHSSIYKYKSMPQVNIVYPRSGKIYWEEIEKNITPETMLVSVMAANNETGAVNPIKEIGRQCRARGIYFHSDVTQYFPRMINNDAFKYCDAISGSLHKLGGPKGIGFLCTRRKITPLIRGSQNSDQRGGTENISGIAGSIPALKYAAKNRLYRNKLMARRINNLRRDLIKLMPESNVREYKYFNGDSQTNYAPPQYIDGKIHVVFISDPADPHCISALPNTLLVAFVLHDKNKRLCNIKMREEFLRRGIQISIGSACNTNKSGSSHVLHALKLPFIIRCGTIRISINDNDRLNNFLYNIPRVLNKSVINK